MLIAIRGAGDIASGIALRLYRCGYDILMTEIERPTSIRRTVCFSEAVYMGKTYVENIEAILCTDSEAVLKVVSDKKIAVSVDENACLLKSIKPAVVIDARLAKKNIDTKITDAPIVIGVGPGFTAGEDCHCVIETQRGHFLGRALYSGSAQENTGIPGNIGGYTSERLLKAPCAGIVNRAIDIGAYVKKGDVCAYVDNTPIIAGVSGIVRGILRNGAEVYEGMKSGDVDPRGVDEYCNYVSDKALAVGGGALEAVITLLNEKRFHST